MQTEGPDHTLHIIIYPRGYVHLDSQGGNDSKEPDLGIPVLGGGEHRKSSSSTSSQVRTQCGMDNLQISYSLPNSWYPKQQFSHSA